jgi:diguanylate cyclase (GGDEF)-like protein
MSSPPSVIAEASARRPAGWLGRLRMRSRLFLAFAAMLGLVVLIAGLGVSWLTQLSTTLNQQLEEQAAIRGAVSDAQASAEAVARKLLVLLSNDRDLRVATHAAVDSSNRRLDAAVVRLERLLPEGPRLDRLQRVKERLVLYRRAHDEAVALVEAGDLAAMRDLLGTRTEVALGQFIEAMHQLAGSEEQAGNARVQALRDEISRDRNLALALCLVGVVVGGLLATGVTRSIVRPLKDAEAGARLIARGQYAHRISVQSADELGHMAGAMNTMAAAVGERERQLRHMADTDLLTGLAQRGRFIAEGDGLLAKLSNGREMAALLCLDVDRLKSVNAALGFDAGDALLRGAAAKLAQLFETVACCGRLGGGTFALLVPVRRVDGADGVEALAGKVRDAVEHKLDWQGQSLDLSVSIGIAHWPAHADSTEGLLRRAEQAMFEAKRLRHNLALYNPGLEASRLLHLSLLSDLQAAIQGDQLRQFLQPKRSLATGRLEGAEALVRWQHPQRGWLPPSEFIPFAESSGRIRLITQWMLSRAVQTLARWQAEGQRLCIAVNITTLDIQDMTLPERIRSLLAEHRVDPQLLQLEVTETGLMASDADPIEVLHALRRLGVRLAIDDFGTGQSSLAYLQRLPVDELKIDRSFIKEADREPKREALLRSIVGLGHSLGLTVTAEGVETQGELEVVRSCACDLVQGYLIARPLDLVDFEGWREGQQASRG